MTSWQASVNWSKNILDERTTWLNARHILSQSQHFQPENRRSCLHCHISCLHCQEVVYIVMPALPPGAAALEGLEIPHYQQKSQIVLLASHHDGNKQGRRCKTSPPGPWTTLGRFPVGVASRTWPPIFPGASWTHGRTNVTVIPYSYRGSCSTLQCSSWFTCNTPGTKSVKWRSSDVSATLFRRKATVALAAT